MKRFLLGILAALAVHAVILLFGGIFFLGHGETQAAPKKVIDIEAIEADKKEEEKPPEPEKVVEEVAEQPEAPPDMSEVVKLQEQVAAANAAPALEALSLSALESALAGEGSGVGGEFALGGSLASGGRIGGTGAPGGGDGEGGPSDAVFSMADLDQGARPIYQPSPTYPFEMNQRKQVGSVSVVFIVDESGRVVDPRIEQASDPAFERPALEAVKQWKFEPAQRGGKKVRTKLRYPIRFDPQK